MNENVKVSKRLFGLLVKYFLLDCKDFAINDEICRELQWKLEAMADREKYKRALSADKPPRSGAVDGSGKGD